MSSRNSISSGVVMGLLLLENVQWHAPRVLVLPNSTVNISPPPPPNPARDDISTIIAFFTSCILMGAPDYNINITITLHNFGESSHSQDRNM